MVALWKRGDPLADTAHCNRDGVNTAGSDDGASSGLRRKCRVDHFGARAYGADNEDPSLDVTTYDLSLR